MAFKIPQPIKMLAAPLAAQASRAYSDPREGKLVIPIELDWDGNGSTFEVNVQGRTTQPFSQIIMLDVDNSMSGADVTFYFPDTTDTLVVPAYSAGLFPVFTNGLLLYAAAPAALSSDVTRLRVLNYLQFPVSNPPPQFHQVATVGSIALASGTTNIIAAGVSGTLVGYSEFVNIVAAGGAATDLFQLIDHTTNAVIDVSDINLSSGASFYGLVANVMGFAYRFAGGIDLKQTVTGTPSGAISVNLKYRTP